MGAVPTSADEAFQERVLQGVSRTFALTIPQLPSPLCRAVSNAYLLCRIADTIEDDAELTLAEKQRFSCAFIDIVEGRGDGHEFAQALAPCLADHALPAERELIAETARVIRITQSFNATQQRAMARCVRIMADGMVYCQGQETLNGVDDQSAMDRYCYYVAGVVGEMLTALFCDHCPELAARETELMHLAVSFGQGLQMTNILKDIWEDRSRGACWLPRDVFQARGVILSAIEPGRGGAGFEDGLGHLIAIAHGHLRNALRFTMIIPPSEQGIRRFCLWALGMAILTLRKLHRRRGFSAGAEVKIPRRAVKATTLSTTLMVSSDFMLKALFELASVGLPQREVPTPITSIAEITGTRVPS